VAADVGDELLVSPDDAATMFYEAEARRRAAVTPLAVSPAWVCVWGASGSVCCLSVCLSAVYLSVCLLRAMQPFPFSPCWRAAHAPGASSAWQHRVCQTRLRVGVITLEGQSNPWTACEFSGGHVHVAVCMACSARPASARTAHVCCLQQCMQPARRRLHTAPPFHPGTLKVSALLPNLCPAGMQHTGAGAQRRRGGRSQGRGGCSRRDGRAHGRPQVLARRADALEVRFLACDRPARWLPRASPRFWHGTRNRAAWEACPLPAARADPASAVMRRAPRTAPRMSCQLVEDVYMHPSR